MTNHVSNYAAAASIGPRFTVAGIMLAILAGWMSANHDDAPLGPIAAVGVVAALSCAWGVVRLRVASDDAASGLVRRSGLLALVGAAILAAVGAWWATSFKLTALGEILGLELFAFLAAAAGWQYLGAAAPGNGWERARSSLAPLSVGMVALGVAALGAFLYVTFAKVDATERRLSAELVPEMVGLLFAGFILFFGGMYLFANRQASPPIESLRWFFLTVGAMLGGLIAFVSLARTYLWSGELFRAGIADTLSGVEAWKFWAVAYGFLVGLGLVLAALGLAFSQISASAGLRRSYYAFGAFVSATLMLVVLATAVVLVYLQAPYNFSWSKTRGVSALSASTKNLLAGLDRPVQIFALINPGTPIYEDLTHFLANCKVFSSKFDYEMINPEKSPEKYKPLATRFKELVPETIQEARDRVGRGVLIVYGRLPDDVKEAVPHAFIPSNKLYEEKGDPGKAMLVLKAETEIMKEISFLANKSEKRKIYFLQGDEELDIFAAEAVRSRTDTSVSLGKFGASKFVDKLKKDRFDVAAVSFALAPANDKSDKKKDIVFLGGDGPGAKADLPDDCSILIVAGPSSPVPQRGLDALERFMDRGGRLIVYFDVFTDRGFTKWKDTGLEAFLKKYGVDVTREVVLRLPQQHEVSAFGSAGRDPSFVLAEAPANAKTLLAKQFQDNPLGFWTARVIKPAESSKYQIEPLLVVNGSKFAVWADGNARGLGDLSRYVLELYQSRKLKDMLSNDPLPVAVTVTEAAGTKPRMVVFGDAEFVSNEDLSSPDPTNYDMARSAIEWMSERGFVGPSPKETSTYAFAPTTDHNSMVWGALWTLIVAIVILGGGVWLIRRR